MKKNEISVENILNNLGINALNDMQVQSLDRAANRDELILLSATGSGKTLAFLLPILTNIDKTDPNTQGLIVVPSRELAMQIEQVFKKMGTGNKITSCYGG